MINRLNAGLMNAKYRRLLRNLLRCLKTFFEDERSKSTNDENSANNTMILAGCF